MAYLTLLYSTLSAATPWQYTLLITLIEFPILVAYFLIILNVLIDPLLRPSLRPNFSYDPESDAYSSPLMVVGSVSALLISTIGFFVDVGELPWAIRMQLGWFGIVLLILGYSLRAYAMKVNKWYMWTVTIEEGHFVEDGGPYHYIRHPGYLGSIIAWLGFALSTGNIILAPVIIVFISSIYWYRIRVEEALLVVKLGDYCDYCDRTTKKLIPFIY